MANRVNPPKQVELPARVKADPELRRAFDDAYFIMFQMWKRIGGGQDVIDDLIQEQARIRSNVNTNTAVLGSIETRNFEIIKTDTSFTTEPFQIVICDNANAINITLDNNPQEDDEVHIKRKNGEVNVIGQIDGFTNKRINIKNYSMHLVYDGSEWTEI